MKKNLTTSSPFFEEEKICVMNLIRLHNNILSYAVLIIKIWIKGKQSDVLPSTMFFFRLSNAVNYHVTNFKKTFYGDGKM